MGFEDLKACPLWAKFEDYSSLSLMRTGWELFKK
jgi:hypothetical protein